VRKLVYQSPPIFWSENQVVNRQYSGVHSACLKGDALFGTMDTWIIWWLTGGQSWRARYRCDERQQDNADNLSTLDWDEEILNLLGIHRQILPRIVPSSDPKPGERRSDSHLLPLSRFAGIWVTNRLPWWDRPA
jgi:glycerol kinase